jgi:hypothetical protein
VAARRIYKTLHNYAKHKKEKTQMSETQKAAQAAIKAIAERILQLSEQDEFTCINASELRQWAQTLLGLSEGHWT